MTIRGIVRILLPAALLLSGCLVAFAQDGKLKINVTPKQAFLFVDGRATGEAGRTLTLSPGEHKLDLHNYGFKPATRTVTITAGKTTVVDVTMEAVPGTVPGPRGAITIEGADRYAVLLNGKTADFFVGHGDEFNHEWLWKQELIVPPGSHLVTIMGPNKEIWSGTVEVPASQRVVLDIPKGVRKTVRWSRGERLGTMPRFQAGTASAAVVVAKPTAQLSAAMGQVTCGGTAELKWTTTDASLVELTSVGPVAATGEQSVQPTQTMNYDLKATGPGGMETATTHVEIDNAIRAALDVSPKEVRFRRVGDQVVEPGTANLNWSAANATSVSIEPFGMVDATGQRTLQATPTKTNEGPVDETVTYSMTATNPCGGSQSRVATLHIVGDIEMAAAAKQLQNRLALRSVYFPTNQPSVIQPDKGLLPSQEKILLSLAQDFQQYLGMKPDARLILSGHADPRGAKEYNRALSERRVQRAHRFLVEQGVPVAALEMKSFGAEQTLTAEQVKKMLEENPDLTPADRKKLLSNLHTLMLANNRRVDVALTTTGQESVRMYPFKAEDFLLLMSGEGKQAPTPTAKPAQKK